MPKDMRQIPLTIGPTSEYGWLGGLAYNEYLGRKATYSSGSDGGIDPFRKIGTLQTGFFASNVNSFITTQINAMQTYSASGTLKLFGYDIIGKVFQIDTTNHSNVSVIASLPSINADYGFGINRDYLFTMHNNASLQAFLTRIGPLSTGVLATTLNASMTATVQSLQIKHVLLPWKSNLYCLHANNIDYLDGNGVNTGILTVGARLPSSMVIKTACPYGSQIVIGASDNLGTSSNRGSICKVYFYDGVSNDWQKEITFPENDILNLSYEYGKLIGYGRNNQYVYNSGTDSFEISEPMDSTAPTQHRAHSANNGQVWLAGNNVVRAYGSPTNFLPDSLTMPYSAVGTGGVCKWISNTKLYVSNSTGNLLYLSAGAGTGVRWKSRFISVDGVKFRVAWVRVTTETLATSDSLIVELNDMAANNYVVGTLNGATTSDGAIASKEFFAKDFTAEPPYATEIQLALNFDGGNPKVRRVDMILETASEY